MQFSGGDNDNNSRSAIYKPILIKAIGLLVENGNGQCASIETTKMRKKTYNNMNERTKKVQSSDKWERMKENLRSKPKKKGRENTLNGNTKMLNNMQLKEWKLYSS